MLCTLLNCVANKLLAIFLDFKFIVKCFKIQDQSTDNFLSDEDFQETLSTGLSFKYFYYIRIMIYVVLTCTKAILKQILSSNYLFKAICNIKVCQLHGYVDILA